MRKLGIPTAVDRVIQQAIAQKLSPILVVYNTIYTLPLMILYLVYVKAQDKFDRLYMIIKMKITQWANVIAPMVTGIIGIYLVFHSIAVLIR